MGRLWTLEYKSNMIRALKNAPLAGVFLSLAALAGCSVTQPVAETTARAVVTQ